MTDWIKLIPSYNTSERKYSNKDTHEALKNLKSKRLTLTRTRKDLKG